MSTGDLISIEPQELQFPFELDKPISCLLQLRNKTNNPVAFRVKVKSKSWKKYSIRPSMGVLQPHDRCDVEVSMRAQKFPPDMQCEDKFVLQSTVASPGTASEDIAWKMFTEESGNHVEEFKLRVSYDSLPWTPLTVREGSEEGFSPMAGSAHTSDYTAAASRAMSTRDLISIEPQELQIPFTMQEQKEFPSDMQCKDKVVLQSIVASSGATGKEKDITPEMFNKESGNHIEESKLIVSYVPPPQTLSPVQEGPGEASSPMAMSFGNENFLSLEKRLEFFQTMQKVVVLVQAPTCSVSGEEDYANVKTGGGVIINNDGVVLTTLHLVPVGLENVIVEVRLSDEDFWDARVIAQDDGKDLVLLEPVEKRGKRYNFAKLADGSHPVTEGMCVYSIGHPNNLYFTAQTGQVAYGCDFSEERGVGVEKNHVNITYGGRLFKDVPKDCFEDDFESYDDNIKLIQLHNFACVQGWSGSPIFNSRGVVVGIFLFVALEFGFALHYEDMMGLLFIMRI